MQTSRALSPIDEFTYALLPAGVGISNATGGLIEDFEAMDGRGNTARLYDNPPSESSEDTRTDEESADDDIDISDLLITPVDRAAPADALDKLTVELLNCSEVVGSTIASWLG